jgi:hypothetical protein
MRRVVVGLALAGGLQACAPVETGGTDPIMPQEAVVYMPDPGPGYPPKMGTVTIEGADQRTVLTTYDFSIGALDGSAWFGKRDDKDIMVISAWPDENPKAEENGVVIEARLPAPPVAGMVASGVVISVLWEGKSEGRRNSSEGHPATFVIDSVSRNTGETSNYGQVTGHFSARLCPAEGEVAVVEMDSPECLDISGTFDTGVQFDG